MVPCREVTLSCYTGISAFDLDFTLLSGNSSYLFGRYLRKKKVLSFADLAFIIKCNVLFNLGMLSIDMLHAKAFDRLFRGRDYRQISRLACEFYEEHLNSILYHPAIEELKNARQRGHYTVILSSSPDFLLKPIAAKLQVDTWQSTSYAVDKDHRFCDISRLIQGLDKAVILEEIRQQFSIAREDVIAYSDSHLDLPFLQAAGRGVGVNPNKKLMAACKLHGWKVI